MYRLNQYILLFALVMSIFFLAGCSSGYKKVNFCWTSDHYLQPESRVKSLDCSVDHVANTIIDWIEKEKGGVVVTYDKDAKKRIKIVKDAKKNYVLAKQISGKEWNAYNTNKYRNWKDGEWESLQKLMENQILIEDYNGKRYYIQAKIGKKQSKINYRVQTDTVISPTYVPGLTAYSPTSAGYNKISIPGAIAYTSTPVYETRSKNIDFYSLMEIYIYEENQAANIYAKASPLDDSTLMVADYGHTIGYSFWNLITGESEAILVQELLNNPAYIQGN